MSGLLFGGEAGVDGPFARSAIAPTAAEREIAEMIWPHRGRVNPVSIRTLTMATGKSERAIKATVEQLVAAHRMMIGGKRGEPIGYYVIVDAEDLETAVRPYREQILAMWRRLRVLLGPKALREMHGQLALAIERGDLYEGAEDSQGG